MLKQFLACLYTVSIIVYKVLNRNTVSENIHHMLCDITIIILNINIYLKITNSSLLSVPL